MNASENLKSKDDLYRELADRLKIKYVFDRFMAIVLLLLTSPIFAVFSILILVEGLFRRECTPILFTETRVSSGKPFRIIKFCTVTREGLNWIAKDPDHRSITGCQYRSISGKIILKFYLDELPQLINILRGEMSFVGPRPHIISMHKTEIEAGWRYRNFIKAGLLGIPQASKHDPRFQQILRKMAERQTSDVDALNTLDGLYVKKCLDYGVLRIVLMDIAIIIKCLWVVVRGEK